MARPKKAQTSTEDIAISPLWTKDDYSRAKNLYSCEIMSQDCSPVQLKEKYLPNDTKIVTYKTEEGKIVKDLVRGKSVSVFDLYWDKIRENLLSIGFAYGTINPRLWQFNGKSKSNKKS